MANGITWDGIFDRVWNKAEGVFDRYLDYEFGRAELDLVKDAQAWQRDQARKDAALQAQWYGTPQERGGARASLGIDPTWLLIGGVGLLAFVAFRG